MQDQNEIYNNQWLLISAIRQAFGVANRSTITYENSVLLARDLAPALLDENSQYINAFVSDSVRLYTARAISQSNIEGRDISPLEILEREIGQLSKERDNANKEELTTIKAEIRRLSSICSKFDQTIWTEAQAINRDADIPEENLTLLDKGQGYKEYSLASDRSLRIRVLHPDPAEILSGVDLIYETYWNRRVEGGKTILLFKIVVLQYKMWDGKVLYTSQAKGLKRQLEKMRKVFCEAKICNPPNTLGEEDRYRLPYCCAFLRPTDKVQTRDAWRATHGWHIPICDVIKAFEPTGRNGNEVLRSERVSSCSVSQDIFQELYNRTMLGSRWLTIQEIENVYNKIGIFDPTDRVVIHASEYLKSASKHP